jgi:hypothetical protein
MNAQQANHLNRRKLSLSSSVLAEAGVARMVNVPGDSPLPIIVIPHLHPGYHVRTSMPPAQFKVYWYSWVATWVHMDTAIKILRNWPHGTLHRETLCKQVMQIARNTLRGSGYYDALDQAKRALGPIFHQNAAIAHQLDVKEICKDGDERWLKAVEDPESDPKMERLLSKRKQTLNLHLRRAKRHQHGRDTEYQCDSDGSTVHHLPQITLDPKLGPQEAHSNASIADTTNNKERENFTRPLGRWRTILPDEGPIYCHTRAMGTG